jgi:hypothetical protein
MHLMLGTDRNGRFPNLLDGRPFLVLEGRYDLLESDPVSVASQ